MLSFNQARDTAQALVERGRAAGADAADAIYIGDRSSGVQVRLGELETSSARKARRSGSAVRRHSLGDGRLFRPVGRSTAALVERAMAMAAEAPEDEYAGLAPDELLMRGEPPILDCR